MSSGRDIIVQYPSRILNDTNTFYGVTGVETRIVFLTFIVYTLGMCTRIGYFRTIRYYVVYTVSSALYTQYMRALRVVDCCRACERRSRHRRRSRDLGEIGVLRAFSALNVCICARDRGVRARVRRRGEWIIVRGPGRRERREEQRDRMAGRW